MFIINVPSNETYDIDRWIRLSETRISAFLFAAIKLGILTPEQGLKDHYRVLAWFQDVLRRKQFDITRRRDASIDVEIWAEWKDNELA